MIHDDEGVEWGTAKEIAERLGGAVHEGMVRQWARPRPRGQGLRKASMVDGNGRPQVRYPFLEAAEIDRRLRHDGRGRKRALDTSRAIPHTATKHDSARNATWPAR